MSDTGQPSGEMSLPRPEPGAPHAPQTGPDTGDAEVTAADAHISAEELDALTRSGPDQAAGGGPVDAEPRVGDVLYGVVTTVRGEDVFVNIGGRAEGIVPLSQFESPPEPGTKLHLVIDHYDREDGLIVLSRTDAVRRASWETLQPGVVVEARVTGLVRSGLEVDLNGIRGFMPASQCDIVALRDISVLLGQRVPVEVLEVSREKKNVVVSRRRVLEKTLQAAREKLLSELEVGQIRTGIVTRLTDYGAFVDLGGVSGLIHISDFTYGRINKPSDMLSEGQRVEVKVLKYNRQTGKIGLGLKQVRPDPWQGVEHRYPVGARVRGTVVRLADFGAFVELEEGIDALVPVSEISWTQRIRRAGDVLSVGQTVEGVVIRVEPDKRRMAISLKQAEADPWHGVPEQYPPGSRVRGRVKQVTRFGAFVELHPGVEGLIHISELSDGRVARVEDVVQPGQEVEVRVLAVDPEARRISLSLKPERPTGDGQATAAPDGTPGARHVSTARKNRKKQLRGGLGIPGGWFPG